MWVPSKNVHQQKQAVIATGRQEQPRLWEQSFHFSVGLLLRPHIRISFKVDDATHALSDVLSSFEFIKTQTTEEAKHPPVFFVFF